MTTPRPAPTEADAAIEAWVQRARGGDLAAFNQLVLRYQDPVYGLTLRMLGAPQAAEDATQEAFIRAWQRLETFRGGSFKSWLFTIAANQARDELRRRGRRPTTSLSGHNDDDDLPDIDPPDNDPTPLEQVEQAELRGALEAALRTLPDDWREIVVLSDIHGMDYREISDATGLALGTVKSRLSRARGRLREVIRSSRELHEAAERLGDRR
jgi:RNA polymerase sigma-70 factor (ECF subfamily)